MNFRKFYFVMTIVVSTFLFCSGAVMLFFMNNLHVLDTLNPNASTSVSNIFKPLAIGKDPINILLLVSDAASGNTDTMMIANYNPVSGNVSIMSVPRDTKVYKTSTKTAKINSVYAGKNGTEKLVTTLDDLMGIKINYYCYFKIDTIKEIIDELGGVDYYVPADMYYYDPTQDLKIDLKKGQQHLDGDKSEQLLRFRKAAHGHNSDELKQYYDGSDLNRIKTQQNFIKELLKQKLTLYYVPKINNIVQLVYKNLDTNMPQTEVFKMLKNISNFSMDKVSTFTLPGTTEDGGAWYYVCDREKASEIVNEYFQTTLPAMSSSAESNEGLYDSNHETQTTKSTTGTKKTEPTKSYTKDNPSNSDSSLNGSVTPAP